MPARERSRPAASRLLRGASPCQSVRGSPGPTLPAGKRGMYGPCAGALLPLRRGFSGGVPAGNVAPCEPRLGGAPPGERTSQLCGPRKPRNAGAASALLPQAPGLPAGLQDFLNLAHPAASAQAVHAAARPCGGHQRRADNARQGRHPDLQLPPGGQRAAASRGQRAPAAGCRLRRGLGAGGLARPGRCTLYCNQRPR